MNPYEKYQKQMVTTMTQGDLLLMLYDEIIKQMEIAKQAIATQQVAEMDAALQKACRIVRHLNTTLDRRYPVSGNLSKLYDFFDNQLVMANIKKDRSYLDDIEPLVADLRATFAQCDKLNRADRVGAAIGDVV